MNKMNRKQLSDLISRIETIHEELDEIKDGEEEKFDNMPENLQDSEKGEALSEIIDFPDSASESLNESVESIQNAIDN